MKPTKTSEGNMGEYFSHPAYGMVSYHRVSGQAKLVGSDLVHQNFIKLTVQPAERNRNLHMDRFHASLMPIVELYMTEQQWATFIASGNTSGVPCTLAMRPEEGAKTVRTPPVEEENRHETAKRELDDTGKEIIQDLILAQATLDEVLKLPNMSKAAVRTARENVARALQQVKSNLPFHLDQHKEFMEDTVQSAKSEVEGYVLGKITELGLEALRNAAPQIDSAWNDRNIASIGHIEGEADGDEK